MQYVWVLIRCLSQCISPKNLYFYYIFVSCENTHGAITLNVVWMEREFDAYKLCRCMCPSNYNCFWDRARYWWKIVIFFIPPMHSTPPLGGFPSEYRHPVWYGKTRMVWLPDGEKNCEDMLFVLTWSTNVTDTHRETDTAWRHRPRLCIASRGNYSHRKSAICASWWNDEFEV